jgi:hypothetical protein
MLANAAPAHLLLSLHFFLLHKSTSSEFFTDCNLYQLQCVRQIIILSSDVLLSLAQFGSFLFRYFLSDRQRFLAE